jgi:3-hydroxyisobutyrate dehydrogenase-like beta-hydroxyacid dehydrogenase
MVGGKPAVFERASEIINVFGRVIHAGPHGTGQLVKLVNQMIVGITIDAVAETLLLCEKGGDQHGKSESSHHRRFCR